MDNKSKIDRTTSDRSQEATEKGMNESEQIAWANRDPLSEKETRGASSVISGKSNGNRRQQDTGKAGGAERGGPDSDKAADRQPPDSDI